MEKNFYVGNMFMYFHSTLLDFTLSVKKKKKQMLLVSKRDNN